MSRKLVPQHLKELKLPRRDKLGKGEVRCERKEGVEPQKGGGEDGREVPEGEGEAAGWWEVGRGG